MADMLVKLYNLPDIDKTIDKMNEKGIKIRRALAPEKHIITDWVCKNFGQFWASECEVAFSNHPVSCYLAIEGVKLLGFSCYDSTCKDFFGPIGIHEDARSKGIGKALTLKCLYDMKAQGYAYAIIGGVGPVEFYKTIADAELIEGSEPGIYSGMLNG